MKQTEIEEMIDESFKHLIDIMFKFPENPYHIDFEEMLFKGKANLIHRFEKIIKQKDKQIDLMAEEINITKPKHCTQTNVISLERVYMTKEEVKQYFERKVKND